MRRRDLIIGAAALASSPAHGETVRTARVLWLSTAGYPDRLLDSFREGLRSHQLVEGRDLTLELHFAPNHSAALQLALAEIRRGGVDLVVSRGAQAIQATRLIQEAPVLFAISGDPVALGIVKSLARPGGNFTGATFLSLDLAAKRVELCKELLPSMRRLAVLSNTDHPGESSEWRATQAAAGTLGIEPVYLPFAGGGELDRALDELRGARVDAVLVFPDGVTYVNRVKLADAARTSRLPSLLGWRDYAEAGGLISYGPDQRDLSLARRLRRKSAERREDRRPARRAADSLRAGDQPQNRRGARPRHPTLPPRPRRRGDRVGRPTRILERWPGRLREKQSVAA